MARWTGEIQIPRFPRPVSPSSCFSNPQTHSEMNKLKECFQSLDEDGSGAIGCEELYDPLIGLGFAKSTDEVQKMVMNVDDDGSGKIEFPEFLLIIKAKDGDEQT